MVMGIKPSLTQSIYLEPNCLMFESTATFQYALGRSPKLTRVVPTLPSASSGCLCLTCESSKAIAKCHGAGPRT